MAGMPLDAGSRRRKTLAVDADVRRWWGRLGGRRSNWRQEIPADQHCGEEYDRKIIRLEHTHLIGMEDLAPLG